MIALAWATLWSLTAQSLPGLAFKLSKLAQADDEPAGGAVWKGSWTSSHQRALAERPVSSGPGTWLAMSWAVFCPFCLRCKTGRAGSKAAWAACAAPFAWSCFSGGWSIPSILSEAARMVAERVLHAQTSIFRLGAQCMSFAASFWSSAGLRACRSYFFGARWQFGQPRAGL